MQIHYLVSFIPWLRETCIGADPPACSLICMRVTLCVPFRVPMTGTYSVHELLANSTCFLQERGGSAPMHVSRNLFVLTSLATDPVSLQALFSAPWHPSGTSKRSTTQGAKALRRRSVAFSVVLLELR